MTDLLHKSQDLAESDGFRVKRTIEDKVDKIRTEAHLQGKRGKWILTLWKTIVQYVACPAGRKRDKHE